ncbi:hypothetical protein OESDEN_17925 [Oesophagostomum dentatum]|uniref:Uncharacterized protein n=1 Tax=Oesophagostomum dentatum TaxID=61180 RepID=A0A0B1SEQ5_OESDE|nr:hypothetical protein OESDEN_17925 [Oesophagostomum dentatum]
MMMISYAPGLVDTADESELPRGTSERCFMSDKFLIMVGYSSGFRPKNAIDKGSMP